MNKLTVEIEYFPSDAEETRLNSRSFYHCVVRLRLCYRTRLIGLPDYFFSTPGHESVNAPFGSGTMAVLLQGSPSS